MYLTFDEYTEMGGQIKDVKIFDSICFEAQSYIDWITFNRLKKDTEFPSELKQCMFEIIKLIQMKRLLVRDANSSGDSDDSENSSVSSMTNDGVAVTYNVIAANELFNKDLQEIRNITRLYLSNVKNSLGQLVLYRGRYWNE